MQAVSKLTFKVGQVLRDRDLIIHVNAPRLRLNAKRIRQLPIVRITDPEGNELCHAHSVKIMGESSLVTQDWALPGFPTAICVLRTSAPVKRIK